MTFLPRFLRFFLSLGAVSTVVAAALLALTGDGERDFLSLAGDFAGERVGDLLGDFAANLLGERAGDLLCDFPADLLRERARSMT